MAEETNITTYISDMIAVEHEILQPVKQQLRMDRVHALPDVQSMLESIEATLTTHISRLESNLEANGGHPLSGAKSAVGDILGGVARAVQDVRPTKLSKSLRDDYAALSLAAVAYEMLYTTSLVTRSTDTAAIAQDHLKDITGHIVTLTAIIADVVSRELLDIDPSLESNVAPKAKEVFREAWEQHPAVTV